MKKLEIIKTGVSLVISYGVGMIVGNLIKCTTPSDIRRITKLCIDASGFILAWTVGDMAAKHAENTIDSTIKTIKDMSQEEDEEEEISSCT